MLFLDCSASVWNVSLVVEVFVAYVVGYDISPAPSL